MRYKNTDALPVKVQGEEKRCGECFHFPVCKPHTEPNETFPEVGGCKCFKNAADVVEVVRCEECKHAYINAFSAQSGVVLCRFWANQSEGAIQTMPQDGFCSYGERREK